MLRKRNVAQVAQVAQVFVLTFAVCMAIIIPSVRGRMATDYERMERLSIETSQQIREAISRPVDQLYTVAAYIQHYNGEIENFEDFAMPIVANPYIRNLLLAPNGVVNEAYPDNEENRKIIGLDYYSDSSEGNREAVIAAETNELVLAGPYTTVVGDEAISGRLPVFIKNEAGEDQFWGLISITLWYPDVLESSSIHSLQKQGWSYELWRIHADTNDPQVISSGGESYPDDRYWDVPMEINNAQWHFKIAPIQKWYQYSESWVYGFIAILISSMMALLMQRNRDLNQIKESQEVLLQHDPLTGLLNRPGLFIILEQFFQTEQPFYLYFLDLNNFKGINDKYGHAAGDYILTEFSQRINQYVEEGCHLARFSGDEFVLVCSRENRSMQDMDLFWDTIDEELTNPILFNKAEVYLTFCKGRAAYPEDGCTTDEVILVADEQMYKAKKCSER